MPGTLDALLRGLPEIWIARNEGDKTWSAREVLAHMIISELRGGMPRARQILEVGESRELEPRDRWGHVQESEGKALGELLDELARLRAQSLGELRCLQLRPEY